MIDNAYYIVAGNDDTQWLADYRLMGADEIVLRAGWKTLSDNQEAPEALQTGRTGMDGLEEQCRLARQAGLRISILFQPACTGNREFTAAGMSEILKLAECINRHQVDFITLSQPFLTNLFRRLCPGVRIKIGAQYDTDSIGKFEFLLENLKVDMIVVSPLANKNFRLLRQVTERWGAERLEIVCTDTCIMGCPYRTWHNRYLAHQDALPAADYLPRVAPCFADILHHKHIPMSAMFVRNQDIQYYQRIGIRRFHVGKADHASYENLKCLKYYAGAMNPTYVPLAFFRELPAFRQIDMTAMDGYYDKFFSGECDGLKYNCTDCDHCAQYAERVLHYSILNTALPEPGRFFQTVYFGNYIRQLEQMHADQLAPPGASDEAPEEVAGRKPAITGQNKAWEQTFLLLQWLQLAPPWIPCEAECATFAQLVEASCRNTASRRVALLGSTHQIRNILASHQTRVDIIDFSENMYALNSRLCTRKNFETFHQADWIRFLNQQEAGAFDLILGDLIVRLLPDASVEALMQSAARALTGDGRMILRIHAAGSEEAPDPETRLDDLLQWSATTQVDDAELRDILFFHLSELFVQSNRLLDISAMRHTLALRCQITKDWRVQAALQPVIDLCTDFPFDIYVRTEAHLQQLIRPCFESQLIYPCARENYPDVTIRVLGKNRNGD